MTSKPHAMTVSAAAALYDSMLQRALQQFFSRASLDTEVVPSDGGAAMAIEPTVDSLTINVKWFDFRHTLRAAADRPFTADEVRLARAIVSVLDARYRAMFDPALMAERLDLFRGAIEDRYVGAFLDDVPYTIADVASRADVIARAIEVLRVAALSRYENREISSGVLLLDTSFDPARGACCVPSTLEYGEGLTTVKSFYRLSDGLRTAFLVSREGKVLDIVEVNEWDTRADVPGTLAAPVAVPYQAHARATAGNHHICIILTPSHEIRVFAEGAHVFTFRNAAWQLIDSTAKYDMWKRAVGNDRLAHLIFQTALDLADMRQGALFVVLRDREGLPQLVAPADRLDLPHHHPPGDGVIDRRDLLHFAAGRVATDLSPDVFRAIATMDGAVVVDTDGTLLAAGAILLHSGPASVEIEGARTAAAFSAAQFGPTLKVSEDGHMSCFDGERGWEI